MKYRQADHNILQRMGRIALRALLFTVMLPTAVLLLAACSMMETDTTACDKDGTETSGLKTYIKMAVAIESDEDGNASRADSYKGPAGGEDGDGREMGQDAENEVKDVTLMLFKCEENDMVGTSTSTDNDKPYVEAFYFDAFTPKESSGDNYYWESSQIYQTTLPLPSSDYRYIVVANCGDKRAYYKGMTLSEVKDDIVKHAWYSNASTPGVAGETASNNDIKSFTNFVMTNEKSHAASPDTDEKEGTTIEIKDDKIIVLAFENIERVAARIDFDNANGTYDGKNGYVYDVTDDSGTSTGDKFVLTHVRPFNCYDGGAYLLKRVGSKEDTVTYLGDEEKDDNGANTNYVLDTTWGKYSGSAWPAATKSQSDFNLYLGTNDAEPTDNWDAYKVRKCELSPSEDSKTKYYILTYTNENTTPDNSLAYATGVLFKGTYYKEGDWNKDKPAEGKTGREMVYRYYLRHSDPNDTYNVTGVHTNTSEAAPMTFGIVRNNIYRVSISGVSKIDDTGKLLIKPQLHVRKWTTYKHDTIDM